MLNPSQSHRVRNDTAKGRGLIRGVARHLYNRSFVSVSKFVPHQGLRVDLIALGSKDEIWIIECKSSRSDYLSDKKWKRYLEWCDCFFWAVSVDFPVDLLPSGTGYMIADHYNAEIIREAPMKPLAIARRRTLIKKFAFHAARHLQRLCDPNAPF